jgi:tetratricopeptide (TPR) repeat protein
MLSLSTDKSRFVKIGVWIQECLFLALGFWFLFYQVRPILILESQSPAFLLDKNFFHSFLAFPGGITDWLAALFMQFWFSNFWVCLFFIICFWLVAFLSRTWMETLSDNHQIHTFHLIPAGILVILSTQYNFHFSIILALIFNLVSINIFIRIAPRPKVLRAAVGIICSLLLFWITGGAFLIFSILCGLDDLFFRRQSVNGLLLLTLSFVLPYIASTTIFFVTLKQAYLHNLIEENQIVLWYFGYALPIFYLLMIILISLSKVSFVRKPFMKINELFKWSTLAYHWKCAIGMIFLMCGTILLAEGSFNNNLRLGLEIIQSIKNDRWQETQQKAMQCTIVNPLFSSQTNLALYQSGILLDRVFSFPQFYGTAGLIMDYDWSLKFPEIASNVYWRLGLVNESLRWAHEAFELKGPTPEILKQLGMAYMFKGNHDAAKKFFSNLKDVPFHQDEAQYLIGINENPSDFAKDSLCQYIQSCIPTSNLMTIVKSPSDELELLLKRNPNNKMAFEYLMTYYLMDGNLQGFLNHFADGRIFNYPRIPMHMQEALLIIASMSTNVNQNQLNTIVEPNTFRRFAAYQQILQNYQSNISKAKQEVQMRFGDTYWFYLMYERSKPLQSEDHNEFQ